MNISHNNCHILFSSLIFHSKTIIRLNIVQQRKKETISNIILIIIH
jgi:hypothetical protein